MKINSSLEISAPPEAVFYWLGDPERAKTWMTEVTGTEILEKKPGWVGTTFRETVSDKTGSTELTGVVTAFVENEKIAFDLQGQFNRSKVSYHLTDIDGCTRLDMFADVRFKSVYKIIMFIAGPAFRKKITDQLMTELATLKKLAEA